MKILNFGSLNIDHTFKVEHIVREGETIDSSSYEVHPGGKGLNQSLAMARAGANVYHAGMIGEDGLFLKKLLEENGVDCRHVLTVPTSTGSAFIQVDREGRNCILLNGGANREITKDYIDRVMQDFAEGDAVVLQNEINLVGYIIDQASAKGMWIYLNPSPADEKIAEYDLAKVHVLILNEHEGKAISGFDTEEGILDEISRRYPNIKILLTLGDRGSVFQRRKRYREAARQVHVVDTTGAGDTFSGFFIAAYQAGETPEASLQLATKASAIAITRKGAANSIPWRNELA